MKLDTILAGILPAYPVLNGQVPIFTPDNVQDLNSVNVVKLAIATVVSVFGHLIYEAGKKWIATKMTNKTSKKNGNI